MTSQRGSLATSPKRARYEVHDEIAAGGMARVHFGRLLGDEGFTRVVAVKKMHTRLADDPRFGAMFLDEARVASRIRHPNVVTTLDVVSEGDDVLIVMEYVRGLPLSTLLTRAADRKEKMSVPIAASIAVGLLAGLHAAHEARGPKGDALGIVHRDVSPQNVLVDVDGVARVMDFGIAKAKTQVHVTLEGELKGKLSYMAPEQILSAEIDRRADVFSAGVVVWTMLAGRKLFMGTGVDDLADQILNKRIPLLAEHRQDIPPGLDAAIAKALERKANDRFATAREFLAAIEESCPRLATQREVGAWVEKLGGDIVEKRDHDVARIEGGVTDVDTVPPRMIDASFADSGTEAPTIELSGSSPIPVALSKTTVSGPPIDDAMLDLPTLKKEVVERPSEPTPVPVSRGEKGAAPKPIMLIMVAVGVATVVMAASFAGLAFFRTTSIPTATPTATSTATPTATSTATPTSTSPAVDLPPVVLSEQPPDAPSAHGRPIPTKVLPPASHTGSARTSPTAATPPGYFPAKP